MSCSQWRIRAAVTAGLAVVVTSGCTDAESASPTAQHAVTRTADGSSGTALSTAAELTSDTPACSTPPSALLDWAGVSIASHPGPITATTLVYAASTDTGDWYVLALDRQLVLDDGTLTGDHSRDLALTNALDGAPGSRKLIPLSEGSIGKGWKVTWDKVSWTGATLAAGQRAAERAIYCLDAAGS